MTDPQFAELDALLRAGILTEIEHAEAREKLLARTPLLTGLDLVAPNGSYASAAHANGAVASGAHALSIASPGAPRHAAARGRHAKQTARWPWIAGSVVLLMAAVVVGLLFRPVHHPARTAAPQPQPSPHNASSSRIVVASPPNTAMVINLDGADAQVIVSTLTPAPVTTTAAKTASTTYTATVTVSGMSGAFSIDPSEFSAHSVTGQSYLVATDPQTTLAKTTVAAGHHAAGKIAFSVPSGEHIAVVLFTTPLGEQLGLWSSS